MMDNTIFGLVGLVIFITASYYSYRIIQNFEKDSRVASSMFFLRDSSSTTFQVVSLLVLTVLIGEGLILMSNYFTDYAVLLSRLGKTSLVVSMFSACYFMRNVSIITGGPQNEEK